MPRQIQGSQQDFSFGQVDLSLKRADDHPARKGGLRQALNARILNSRGVQNRPGSRALFLESGRVDKVKMSPGNEFYLAFGNDAINGTLTVYNSAGAQVFTQNGFVWSIATAKDIVWCQDNQKSIYIFSALQQPVTLTWDGVATWSIANYAETVSGGGQKRTFFYRISPKNVTMQPLAVTGSGVLCNFSAGMNLTAGHIGTLLRYVNRQVLITAVNTPMQAVITIMETLPPGQTIGFAVDPRQIYNVGDVVFGRDSGARGVVTEVLVASLVLQLLTINITQTTGNQTANPLSFKFSAQEGSEVTIGFLPTEVIVGPGGSLTATSVANQVPRGITYWDDEVMNSLRGYPASGFFDQNRLGMCNFPSVPSGVGWSAIGLPNDLYVEGTVNAAIFELAPNKSRVLYVTPGAESSEFVFCDNRIYYIPISTSNPLKPGSISFNQISGDGCYPVQPRPAGTTTVFLAAGGKRVSAIVAIGENTRPYDISDLTEFHTSLLSNPIAIAIPTADEQFSERYAYVLNDNGTVCVGKYTIDVQQQIKGSVGWVIWFSPTGSIDWASAFEGEVIFRTTYVPPGIAAPAKIVEQVDNTLYLDGSMLVNAAPAAFAPPVGKGPLWWLAGGTVDLMDQVTRAMGTYQVDADGFIVPQFNGGENLALASLVAGQPWTMTLEPFAPNANSGADVHQRMIKRRISNFAAHVLNSTGFTLQKLFSAKETPTSPPPGTPMSIKRVQTWNVGDNPTLPPKQRNTVETWRPSGHSFDPRVALIKDTPGPLTVTEFGMEITL